MASRMKRPEVVQAEKEEEEIILAPGEERVYFSKYSRLKLQLLEPQGMMNERGQVIFRNLPNSIAEFQPVDGPDGGGWGGEFATDNVDMVRLLEKKCRTHPELITREYKAPHIRVGRKKIPNVVLKHIANSQVYSEEVVNDVADDVLAKLSEQLRHDDDEILEHEGMGEVD